MGRTNLLNAQIMSAKSENKAIKLHHTLKSLMQKTMMVAIAIAITLTFASVSDLSAADNWKIHKSKTLWAEIKGKIFGLSDYADVSQDNGAKTLECTGAGSNKCNITKITNGGGGTTHADWFNDMQNEMDAYVLMQFNEYLENDEDDENAEDLLTGEHISNVFIQIDGSMVPVYRKVQWAIVPLQQIDNMREYSLDITTWITINDIITDIITAE